MMIEKIYAKYFQKSKSFLYPALGIKKNSFTSPEETYIAIKDCIGADEMKLICVFKDPGTVGFNGFEQKMLLENPLFHKATEAEGLKIYVFDMSIYKQDWFNFIMGKYSKLSPLLKKSIKAYYGEHSSAYSHMETYLYPEKHFETYANILDVNVENLKRGGELCDPCDLEKETLIIPVELLSELVEKE